MGDGFHGSKDPTNSMGLLICKNRLPYNLCCVGGDVVIAIIIVVTPNRKGLSA